MALDNSTTVGSLDQLDTTVVQFSTVVSVDCAQPNCAAIFYRFSKSQRRIGMVLPTSIWKALLWFVPSDAEQNWHIRGTNKTWNLRNGQSGEFYWRSCCWRSYVSYIQTIVRPPDVLSALSSKVASSSTVVCSYQHTTVQCPLYVWGGYSGQGRYPVVHFIPSWRRHEHWTDPSELEEREQTPPCGPAVRGALIIIRGWPASAAAVAERLLEEEEERWKTRPLLLFVFL